jgi:hypothetical protein
MLCTELTKIKPGKAGLVIEPLKCKRWTCEHCAPMLRRMFIAKCLAGNPTTFITLTIRADFGTLGEQAARLVSAWRIIRQRWKREHNGQEIPFIARLEPHPSSGRPHMHILCRAPYIPQRWLSHRMQDLAGSPVCDIRAVRSRKHAAVYLAKYLGKNTAHKYPGSKRWWRSHDYDQTPPELKRARQLDSIVVRENFENVYAHKVIGVVLDCYTVQNHHVRVDFRTNKVCRRC